MQSAADAEDRDSARDLAALSGVVTTQGLRETFGQCRIFPYAVGWSAIRGGEQKFSGPPSLIARVLRAADLPSLAEKLHLQEWLDALDPAELKRVWLATRYPETPR